MAIYLIGAGGHGKVIAEIFQDLERDLRVLDGGQVLPEQMLLGHGVEEELTVLEGLNGPVDFFVALGQASSRQEATERWLERGHTLARAIHPTATVSPSTRIDGGVCIMAGAIVQAESHLGRGAIVNTAASIDHDVHLGAYAHVAPGCHLAGTIEVGEHAWIGIGSVVREGISIGAHSFIGAGSVVVQDIPPGVLAYGNPCRVIRALE